MAQTEKQRVIWAYKILFLDVLFPLSLRKVIFVDSDQIVRADFAELWYRDLQVRPLVLLVPIILCLLCPLSCATCATCASCLVPDDGELWYCDLQVRPCVPLVPRVPCIQCCWAVASECQHMPCEEKATKQTRRAPHAACLASHTSPMLFRHATGHAEMLQQGT